MGQETDKVVLPGGQVEAAQQEAEVVLVAGAPGNQPGGGRLRGLDGLLQRCLTEETLPLDVRAAGAITLLFGPSTERLCNLTPDHLQVGDKHTHLLLGRHPVLLPPRLAGLLRQLTEESLPGSRSLFAQATPGPRLLFPGLVPGKPIATHAMTQKLNRHGISVRAACNSALAALAADLPSPILADLTGMHRHTAIRWVAYARRDWAVTRRSRRGQSRGGEEGAPTEPLTIGR